ncbi:MAG: hypothetical protein WC196_02810 [Bacilli bacterium]
MMREVIIAMLGYLVGFGIGFVLGKTKSNREFKSKVARCFDGVDWTQQSFSVNNSGLLENKQGEKSFYRVPPIDEAVRKFNALKP